MSAAPDDANTLETRSYYVRGRNALVVRADFGPLYEDYYLHWLQHGIQLKEDADDMLKDALAALVLHLASRPVDETVAWTLNLPSPSRSLFVTGSGITGRVVGRVWTEGVRTAADGLFCAEVCRADGARRRSNVGLDRPGIFDAVETYYAHSEQRPARLFRHGPEDIVLVAAQPDCDLDWLAGLDDVAVRALDRAEELSLLETRHFHFACGCTAELIAARLAVLSAADLDAVFDGDEAVTVDCPRCGATHEIRRGWIGSAS